MDAIPGWNELVAYVGAPPVFADASILDLSITASGEGALTVKTFVMPDGENYDYSRPVIVTLRMGGLEHVELDEFAANSVFDELKIERTGEIWSVDLDPAYGLRGRFQAHELRVEFTAS